MDTNNPLTVETGIMKTLEQLVEQNRQLIEQNLQLIGQNRVAIAHCGQILDGYEQLEERIDEMQQGLLQNLREFYAIILETLSASIGARRLTWNYVAHTVLEQSGFTEEQIKQRYEAERGAWIQEKENIADALEEAILKMPPRP